MAKSLQHLHFAACLYCRQTFRVTHVCGSEREQYCSRSCSQRSRIKQKPNETWRYCRVCFGLYKPAFHVKKGLCSSECGWIYRRLSDEYRRNCKTCGKQICSRSGIQHYCSRNCYPGEAKRRSRQIHRLIQQLTRQLQQQSDRIKDQDFYIARRQLRDIRVYLMKARGASDSVSKLPIPSLPRVLSKIQISSLDPAVCWNWVGSCSSAGKPKLTVDCCTSSVSVARVIWHQTIGSLPGGIRPGMTRLGIPVVQQMCGNKTCFRPSHLTLHSRYKQSDRIENSRLPPEGCRHLRVAAGTEIQ